LSTLAYLHWNAIGRIIGSDVDEGSLFRRWTQSWVLLAVEGLGQAKWQSYPDAGCSNEKASHAVALKSAEKLGIGY